MGEKPNKISQVVHSHRLPRHSVADSPTPFPAVEDSEFCQNHSCPVNYCYNHGHCDISGPPGCQPTCTCAPAFTGNRCFLAGNNFTPIVSKGMADCSFCASPSRLSCLGMMGTLVYEARVPQRHRSELHVVSLGLEDMVRAAVPSAEDRPRWKKPQECRESLLCDVWKHRLSIKCCWPASLGRK